MDTTGLYQKFKINRPLSQSERDRQLRPASKVGIAPYYFWSTIRANSTFLELTDKFYAMKGMPTIGVFICMPLAIALLLLMCVAFVSCIPPLTDEERFGIYSIPFVILLCLGLIWLLLWGLRKESFSYTHFPIRFNRKTRMVHVFRQDGTVLSASWDKLFFTISPASMFMGIRNWDLSAHLLDPDGSTVRETFALPRCFPDRSYANQRALWEYVRRYMEERDGVQLTIAATPMYLPITKHRESWSFGMRRMLIELTAPFPVARYFFFPFVLPQSLGRWFAMRTSRIPVWPREIEDVCRIDPNDRYERDERDNPTDLRPFMSRMDWNGDERSLAN